MPKREEKLDSGALLAGVCERGVSLLCISEHRSERRREHTFPTM